MTPKELQLATEVAQSCLGDPGFDAMVVQGEPLLFEIIIGGQMDGVMFTTSSTTLHAEIQARIGSTHKNYITHIIQVVRKAKADCRQAVLEHYLNAGEQ